MGCLYLGDELGVEQREHPKDRPISAPTPIRVSRTGSLEEEGRVENICWRSFGIQTSYARLFFAWLVESRLLELKWLSMPAISSQKCSR
jgi:hypothetical protein